MASSWTTERVLHLAPDDASAKAGRGLADPRKWSDLGRTDRTVWGQIRGSGSKPYQTRVDLEEPAFKCSCPSRKFPCKHSLALLLAWAEHPEAFAVAEPPGWVSEWLAQRADRAEKRAAKQQQAAEPPDAETLARREADKARRAERREQRAAAGLEQLELLVRDIVRRGLAAAQQEPMSFWEGAAARMVDAQAPGCARVTLEMAEAAHSGELWQGRLMEHLCRLHLLIEGHRRAESLPEPVRQEIRARIGWTQAKEDLLAREGTRDRWQVLAQRVEVENQLRVQRTWLWAKAADRPALVLDFAQGAAPLDATLAPGTEMDAEMVYYDGAFPLRALLRQRGDAAPLAEVRGVPDIGAAASGWAAALAACPWVERLPMLLAGVRMLPRGERWIVRDEAGRSLPLADRFRGRWELAAVCGGRPASLFGEWDGLAFRPLSVWCDRRLVSLRG